MQDEPGTINGLSENPGPKTRISQYLLASFALVISKKNDTGVGVTRTFPAVQARMSVFSKASATQRRQEGRKRAALYPKDAGKLENNGRARRIAGVPEGAGGPGSKM